MHRITWLSAERIITEGRFDAIINPAPGVVIIGSREWTPGGRVYKSTDYARVGTFDFKHDLGSYIRTFSYGQKTNRIFARTFSGQLWGSDDLAETWFTLATTTAGYGIHALPSGTVLIADALTPFQILRSIDNGVTFTSVFTGAGGFYRFMQVADGVVLNSFDGKVLKSRDDGLTWEVVANIPPTPVYGIETLADDGRVMIGDELGKLYVSAFNGDGPYRLIGQYDGASDDLASLGNGLVLHTTYTSQKNVYLLQDERLVHSSSVPTVTGDVFDHVIPLRMEDGSMGFVGGTVKGYVVTGQVKG